VMPRIGGTTPQELHQRHSLLKVRGMAATVNGHDPDTPNGYLTLN